MTLTDQPRHAPEAPRRLVPPSGAAPRLLLALAAVWLVPFAAYYAHAAVILPVLVLAGTASLLRAGRTVVDRVVLAFFLLFGVTCAAGLPLSVWPWGLHPVPVAGLAGTALVVTAAVTGRRPRFPRATRRGRLTSAIVLLSGAAVAVLMAVPFAGRAFAGRLSVLVIAEDLARHYALFDNIRAHGGYTFLHKAETAVGLRDSLVAYPQGSHLLMGLLDGFVRSDTSAGSPQSALGHFFVWYAASFVLLCATVVWAIRWVAGPAMSPWRYLPVAAAATGYLFFGDGVAMFMRGFPSEFAGLALLAALMAVTARPLPRTREQVLVLGSLLVGVSFTYYLFLPLAGVMTLWWLVTRRRRAFAVPVWTAVVGVLTAVLAVVPIVVNLAYANSTDELNAAGGISPVNRHLLFTLLLVAGAGFLTREAWRHPVRRTAGLWTVAAALAALLLFLYQSAVLGETSYYYEKLLHQLFVVGLVALGASRLVVPRWTARRPPWLAPPVSGPVAAITATACLLATLSLTAGPDRKVWRKPPKERSWGVSYVLGDFDQPNAAKAAAAALAARPAGDDHVGLMQIKGDWQANYFGSLWLGVLSRDYGRAWPAWTPLGRQEKPAELGTWLTSKAPLRIRVFTNDPETYRVVQEMRRDRPDLGTELMWSSPVRCTYRFTAVPAPAPGKPVAPPAVPAPAERGCGARG